MSNASTSDNYLRIDFSDPDTLMNQILSRFCNNDNIAFLFPVTKHCKSTLVWITDMTGIKFDNPETITNINDIHRVFRCLATLMECVGAEQILAFGKNAKTNINSNVSPNSKMRPKTTAFRMIGNQNVRKSLSHWNHVNAKPRDYCRALSFASEFAFCAGKWINTLLNYENCPFTDIEFLNFYLTHYKNKNVVVNDTTIVNNTTIVNDTTIVNEETKEEVREEMIEKVITYTEDLILVKPNEQLKIVGANNEPIQITETKREQNLAKSTRRVSQNVVSRPESQGYMWLLWTVLYPFTYGKGVLVWMLRNCFRYAISETQNNTTE